MSTFQGFVLDPRNTFCPAVFEIASARGKNDAELNLAAKLGKRSGTKIRSFSGLSVLVIRENWIGQDVINERDSKNASDETKS